MFFTILLNLIVFFLPTQLGLHFWPPFSRAAGIKIDYLSPTLYFTDLLLISFILLSLPKIISWVKLHLGEVLICLSFIVLNTVFGLSPLNSLFWWLRLALYALFFLTLRLNKVSWSTVKLPLVLSVSLIVTLEVFQVFYQHSLGGLFYWLGERNFNTSTSGLARMNLFGFEFVRAPSTFSHPNSLAGYLLIVFYLLHFHKSPLWTRLVVFVGLLLTFSKAALLAFLLVVSFQFNSGFLIVGSYLLSLAQLILPAIPGAVQFVSDRLFLLLPAKNIIFHSPFWGVGVGNFIPALANTLPGSFLIAEKLQPVHNLPVLLFAEVGLFGIGLLVIFLKKHEKSILTPKFLALLALVLITGAFDHYWWTIPQNKLIFLLAAAIML